MREKDKRKDKKRPWRRRGKSAPSPEAGAPGLSHAIRDLLGLFLLIALIAAVIHYVASSKVKIFPKELIEHKGPYSSLRFTVKNTGWLPLHSVHYSCEVLNFFLGVGEREDLERKKRPVVSLPQADIPEISGGQEAVCTCTFEAKLTELIGYEILIRLSYDPQFLQWLPRNDQFRFRIDKSPEGRYALVEVGRSR